MDFFVHLVLGTIMFLGGYQPYFWCQRRTLVRSRVFDSWWATLDRKIPLCPSWIWFYTVFYYPVIVLVVSMRSRTHDEFAMISFSYMVMLAAMCTVYMLLPVTTPEGWRDPVEAKGLSTRMLAFVRSIDGSNNCFPSGHAAVTVITAFHMAALVGPWVAAAWALSIHLSCLLCKQHYLVDLFAGAGLGWAVILLYRHF